MQLSEEAIKEFEVLWKEDFPDINLSPGELQKKAERLILAFQLVYKPIPHDSRESFMKLESSSQTHT